MLALPRTSPASRSAQHVSSSVALRAAGVIDRVDRMLLPRTRTAAAAATATAAAAEAAGAERGEEPATIR